MEALITKGGPCFGRLEVSVSKNSIAALNNLMMMMVTFHQAFGSQANDPKKLGNATEKELLMMTFNTKLLMMTFKAFGISEVLVSKNSIAALNRLMMTMVTFQAFGSQANDPKKLRNATKKELLMMTFNSKLLMMTFKAFGMLEVNGPKILTTGTKKLPMMTLKAAYSLEEALLCTIQNHTSIGFILQKWTKLALVDVANIGDFQKEQSLACDNWFLPEDLVIDEILSRLSVKSLMRFKSVSKRWFALPTNHCFISMHRKNINTPNRLVSWNGNDSGLIAGHDAFHVFTECRMKGIVQPVNLDFGFDRKPDLVMGPCDGIFCLYWRPKLYLVVVPPTIALWNPATREFSTLPMSNFDFPPYKKLSGCLIGFGFDLTTKVIKVVKVVSFWMGGPNGEPPRRYLYPKIKRGDPPRKSIINCAEVYDLDSGSWRVLHVDGIFQEVLIPNEYAFVGMYNTNDGVFNWLTSANWCRDGTRDGETDCRKFVLSFDMSRELFHVTVLPESINFRWISRYDRGDFILALLRDSVAVIFSFFEQGHTAVEVWVMRKDLDRMVEEAGESFSSSYTWSREFTVEPPALPFPCVPTGFWNKNELIIWKNHRHRGWRPISRATPVLYDIVAKQARDVQISGEWNFIYRESLVSVKKLSALADAFQL